MFRLSHGAASILIALSIAATSAVAEPTAPATTAAPPSSSPPTTTSAVTVPDPNKIICRREEVTGSNMAEHVCHTRAEWARLSEEHKTEIDNYIRQHKISGCGSRGC